MPVYSFIRPTLKYVGPLLVRTAIDRPIVAVDDLGRILSWQAQLQGLDFVYRHSHPGPAIKHRMSMLLRLVRPLSRVSTTAIHGQRSIGSVSAIDSGIFRTLFGTEEIRKVRRGRSCRAQPSHRTLCQ